MQRNSLWNRFCRLCGIDPEINNEQPLVVTGQGDTSIEYTADEIARELGMNKPQRFSIPDPQPSTETIAREMGIDVACAECTKSYRGFVDALLELLPHATCARAIKRVLHQTEVHCTVSKDDLAAMRRKVSEYEDVQLEKAVDFLTRVRAPETSRPEHGGKGGTMGDAAAAMPPKDQNDGYGDLRLEATRRCQGTLETAYLTRFLISMKESDVPFHVAHNVMRMVYDFKLADQKLVKPTADDILG